MAQIPLHETPRPVESDRSVVFVSFSILLLCEYRMIRRKVRGAKSVVLKRDTGEMTILRAFITRVCLGAPLYRGFPSRYVFGVFFEYSCWLFLL